MNKLIKNNEMEDEICLLSEMEMLEVYGGTNDTISNDHCTVNTIAGCGCTNTGCTLPSGSGSGNGSGTGTGSGSGSKTKGIGNNSKFSGAVCF